LLKLIFDQTFRTELSLFSVNLDYLMPRLHLTVLMTRNETWRLWKRISKF